MEKAATQESVGQFLFVVRRNDHDRAVLRRNRFVGFINIEAHAIEFLQQVVRELDVSLVDFIDQQDGQLRCSECFPKFALLDVILDVVDAFITQLTIAQTRDRVIFVQTLMGLGRALDIPGDQGGIDRLGNFLGQHGLAGAGFTFHQQGPPKRYCRIHRNLEIVGCHIILSA